MSDRLPPDHDSDRDRDPVPAPAAEPVAAPPGAGPWGVILLATAGILLLCVALALAAATG